MGKKRKLCVVGGLELQQAYDSLLKLKESRDYEEGEEEDKPNGSLQASSSEIQPFDATGSLLGSRVEGAQSPNFSTRGKEELVIMKIQRTGLLLLKKDCKERVATTISLGQNEFWSSANLYNQLNVLENLITRETEDSARAWIDTFFFRASAMLPADKRIVISPSSLLNLSGNLRYTAVVTNQSNADIYLRNPEFETLKMLAPPIFFIIEAKHSDLLQHSVPQAICEIYACGKLLQKKVVRGAVSSGCQWIFFILKFNDNYDGATYLQSKELNLKTTQSEIEGGLSEVSSPWPDYIAAILSHWIENSSADLQSDDWYEIKEE